MLSEYLPNLGISLHEIASTVEREVLIRLVVAVSRLSRRDEDAVGMTDEFVASLDPAVASRLRLCLGENTGGMGRRLVAPHPLLMALRWLISNPIAEPTGEVLPLNVLPIIFVQGIADELHAREALDDDELTEEQKLQLLLILTNLESLGAEYDPIVSLDRTLRLWRDFGQRTVDELGSTATELFQRACGATLEEVVAVGFALWAHAVNWKSGDPLLVGRMIHPEFPAELGARVFPMFARSLEQSIGELSPEPASPYDTLGVEEFPVLEVGDSLLVLDERLMWERMTNGLFWFVHESLRVTDAEGQSASKFRKAHGLMIEDIVLDSFSQTAVPLIGSGGKTFYTEKDLQAAYPKAAQASGKRCDAALDFGSYVLLVEVVSGRLSVPARCDGDLNKLVDDFENNVFGKARQLHETAQHLLVDDSALTGSARRDQLRILPLLVSGGGIQFNPVSHAYVRHILERRGWLQHARIEPFGMIDLDDVDALVGLSERGLTPIDLLVGWRHSDIPDVPFRNYLIREGHGAVRPERSDQAVADTIATIGRVLGFQPDRLNN